MRRVLSIFMAIALLVVIVPYQVFADSDVVMSGDGSASNPYIITTIDQLNAVRDDLDAYYNLGANIDASETAGWNNGKGFVPIGDGSRFNGVFDGQGYVIRNLTINQPEIGSVGLFGIIDNTGVVRNVGLEGGSFTGGHVTGSLAGLNYGSVDRSYASAFVSGSAKVGGMVGWNYTQGKITYSHSTGDVNGSSNIGGLVGRNDGSIDFSYASGDVSGSNFLGGLVGDSEAGEINQSYATGNVSGSGTNIGGLIGIKLSGSVHYSYATGSVSGQSAVGGLVGHTVDFGPISQSYATGAVSGTSYVGGLIGSNNGASLIDNYWDKETTEQNNLCGWDLYGDCSGEGLTTAQALTQMSYSGWDFTNDWFMVDGSTRPFLRSEWSAAIQNTHQLQLIEMDPMANYRLTKDIDFRTEFTDGTRSDMWATSTSGGLGFEPIGSELNNQYFSGTFDGQGHTISGLYINRISTAKVGMFSQISGGEVRDLNLKNGDISGSLRTGMLSGENGLGGRINNINVTGLVTGTDNTGGLVGYNSGTIRSSGSGSTVNGRDAVGGLVGWNSSGSVTEAVYATGSVSGNNHIGGLIGSNAGSVRSAYATGNVNGSQFNIGGLVGLNDFGSQVSESYATGSIIGMGFVGGLIGRNEFSRVNNAYAIGSVRGHNEVGGLVGRNVGKIDNTYAVGSVTGNGDVGGLVGREFDTVSASYYNKETTGQSDTGKGESKATSEMKQHAAYGAEWDFDGTWILQEGKTYPVLQGIAANLKWDAAPPTIVSAKIVSEHPDQVILTFDEEVSLTNAQGIGINTEGMAVTVIRVDGAGTKALFFTVGEMLGQGQQVLLSYDKQSGNISDLEGNALLSITDRMVEIIPPVDNTPPSLALMMTKADGNAYVDGEWTNQSVNVSAEATDESSVTSLTYSLDSGATWSPYITDIILRDNGVHRLTFKAVDAAGNESVERRTINISTAGISLTPTIVKADGSDYASGKWTNANVTMSVYAETGISEIANLTYSLNGGAALAYENKAPIEISGEGVNTILFQVSDKAGNSLSMELPVKIDKTPPSIRIHPNGNEIRNTSATSKVTVTDEGSNTDDASLQYAWTTDPTAPTVGWIPFSSGSSLTKSDADGDWYLHIRAQDQADNERSVTSSRFRLTTQRTGESNGSSHSSNSGENLLPNNTFLIGVQGRTVAFDGGQIIIPAGALNRPFYLTINEITRLDDLSLSEGRRWVSKVIEFKKDVAGEFDKDATISLRFDTDYVRKENNELRLCSLSEDTNEWVELENIIVDWHKGIISGTTDHFTKFAVIERPIVKEGIGVHFTDIKGHWAQKNIENLAEKGALNGYTDSSFKPDRTISRAEFTAILVRALGLTNKGNKTFSDTTDHWAGKDISTAYSYGIIHGYDLDTFAPDDAITREQMGVMVVNALQLDDASSHITFADQDEIAAWAQKAVITAVGYGLINGYPNNTMKPKAYATRAEAITLIWRAIEVL